MGLSRFFCYPAFLLMIFYLTQGRIIHRPDNRLQASGWMGFPNKLYENVEVFILSNSNLPELKPYVFNSHGFHNLNKALLRYNNITAIYDNAFAKMFKIVQLDLQRNKLVRFSKNSFSGLNALKHLHLGSNQIRSVEAEVLKPLRALETLDLSHNSITVIESDFLKHTAIVELNLENNPLILQRRGPILESATLSHLNLHYCNLDNLPLDVFSKLPNLESLDMSENQLKILPGGMFKQNVHLTYLDISYNLLTDVNKVAFPAALEELYCQGNPLEDGFYCNKLLASTLHDTNGKENSTEPSSTETDAALVEVTPLETISGSISINQIIHSHQNNDRNAESSSIKIEDFQVNDDENRNSDRNLVEKLTWGIVGVLIICLIILLIALFGTYYILRQHNNKTNRIYLNINEV